MDVYTVVVDKMFYIFLSFFENFFLPNNNFTKTGSKPRRENGVTEYAEGVTSHNPELFIEEKQPERKSIIQH